jgi:hypothetical protein
MPAPRVPVATDFIVGWIGRNVRPYLLVDYDGPEAAVSDLIDKCLGAADVFGISAADVEAATSYRPVEWIWAALLAEWQETARSESATHASALLALYCGIQFPSTRGTAGLPSLLLARTRLSGSTR